MANPKRKEQEEHKDRKARFKAAFTNATDVLKAYKNSRFFKTFPDKKPHQNYIWELREQFFMAAILDDSLHQRSVIWRKIEQSLNEAQRQQFTHAYMKSAYTFDAYAEKLEPAANA